MKSIFVYAETWDKVDRIIQSCNTMPGRDAIEFVPVTTVDALRRLPNYSVVYQTHIWSARLQMEFDALARHGRWVVKEIG